MLPGDLLDQYKTFLFPDHMENYQTCDGKSTQRPFRLLTLANHEECPLADSANAARCSRQMHIKK